MGTALRAASVYAVVCLLLAVSAQRAAASTFVLMDEHDLVDRSEAALVGRVTDVRSAVDASSGGIFTYVAIAPRSVLYGPVDEPEVILVERGGAWRGRNERVFGSPTYRVGEDVLVFLSRSASGELRTTGMAMGKYELRAEAAGSTRAVRTFGDGVRLITPEGLGAAAAAPGSTSLRRLLANVRADAARRGLRPGRALRAARLAVRPVGAPFTFLGEPSRWHRPDEGWPIEFRIDSSGDSRFGLRDARAAVNDAFAAWSEIAGSSLLLADAGLTAKVGFSGCGASNRVIFDDPADDIEPPTDCRGVIAIGGYCYDDDEKREVNGTTFNRITVGKVTVADGWTDCPFWDLCALSEVVTHELGHALGFGHSEDRDATMRASAHFDGRCASLVDDDIAGARFVYPGPAESAATAQPTRTSTATFAASPIATATATPTSTREPDRTPTPTRPGSGTASLAGRVLYRTGAQAVPGAAIQLLGASDRTSETDAAGGFSFASLDPGVRTLSPAKNGGNAGAITSLDAAWVLQAVVGMREIDPLQALACDVTGNGSLSPLDASLLLKRSVGRDSSLPVIESCESEWLFAPSPAPAANQEIIEPRVGPGSCRRGAISFAPLDRAAVGQDFAAVLLGDCTGNWRPEGAAAVVAPAGTSIELQPIRRARGGRLRLPIAVWAPEPFHALDLELRYDRTRLALHAVRPGSQEGSLVDAEEDVPGRVHVALASGTPLPGDGRIVVLVEFQGAIGGDPSPSLHLFSASVDELSAVRQ